MHTVVQENVLEYLHTILCIFSHNIYLNLGHQILLLIVFDKGYLKIVEDVSKQECLLLVLGNTFL